MIFIFHIWDVILPIGELIFFKIVIATPTSLPTKLHHLTNNTNLWGFSSARNIGNEICLKTKQWEWNELTKNGMI
jgi:hypothetical protein